MGAASAVGVSASLLAGDPVGLPCACRDLAIEAHSELGRDERATGEAVLDVELVEPGGSVLEQTDRRLDARVLEHAQAGAPHSLVRVGHRDDHALDARVDHGLGARGCAVDMRAWLEVDV